MQYVSAYERANVNVSVSVGESISGGPVHVRVRVSV